MNEIFTNLGINWKLLLAQAANFLLVFFVLKKFIFPRVLKFIAQREEVIKKGFDLTSKAEKEIQKTKQFVKQEVENAKEKSDEILAASKILAQQKGQEIEKEAKNSAGKILIQAKVQAQKEQNDLLMSSKEEISKTAFWMAEQILARDINEKDEKKAAEEVRKYLEKNYAGSAKQN